MIVYGGMKYEKNSVEIALTVLKVQKLSKRFWTGIQRMSAEDERYKMQNKRG
jgi:hypothetical protein